MSCPGVAMDGPCQPSGMSTASPVLTSVRMSVFPAGEGVTRW